MKNYLPLIMLLFITILILYATILIKTNVYTPIDRVYPRQDRSYPSPTRDEFNQPRTVYTTISTPVVTQQEMVYCLSNNTNLSLSTVNSILGNEQYQKSWNNLVSVNISHSRPHFYRSSFGSNIYNNNNTGILLLYRYY